MRFVPTAKLAPGQIVERDVCNFHGQRLLGQGTELSARHITILKSWGVAEVAVRTADEPTQSTEPGAPSEAELLIAAEAIQARFCNTDRNHPVIRELCRLATLLEATRRMAR